MLTAYPIDKDSLKAEFMAYSDYVPVTSLILSLTNENDCCSQMMALQTEDSMIHFVIGPETRVIDCRRLLLGLRVTAFYDRSLPAPLIYPP
ncbi:MAG: hypothetical protein J6K48_00040 [Lachnospiraceae bacterium]|nr:hypothetical protein [Lachnospiraceae bacterium]